MGNGGLCVRLFLFFFFFVCVSVSVCLSLSLSVGGGGGGTLLVSCRGPQASTDCVILLEVPIAAAWNL